MKYILGLVVISILSPIGFLLFSQTGGGLAGTQGGSSSGTIPNTVNFLIGGASNTAGNSGIAPSNIVTTTSTNLTVSSLMGTNGAGTLIAAPSSLVISQWSGTCNSSTLLGADGICKSISVPPTSAALLATDSLSTPIVATAHSVASVGTCVSASASSTAYTCSTVPTFTPTLGDMILFKADVASTTTGPTLSVNSQAGKLIRIQGNLIVTATIAAANWYLMLYDGTVWEIVSTPSIAQGGVSNNNWSIDTVGQAGFTNMILAQAAGSPNSWQVFRPDLKYIGIMADHQLVWRSSATGSWFSSGSVDTGISRIGAGVLGIGTGAQGSVTGFVELTSMATIPVSTSALNTCTAVTGIPWRAAVNDATAPALGIVLTGGGSVFANVHCSLTTGTYLVDGL